MTTHVPPFAPGAVHRKQTHGSRQRRSARRAVSGRGEGSDIATHVRDAGI